ncbi:MAG: hypothetical protein WC695_08250 [Candidatus Omnitrophota bacterium]
MGVIYKLRQDVVDHILEIKQDDPLLSCRKLSVIISNKFKSQVSKSSINAVLKQASLSMPVGRRRKQKRNNIEAAGLGAFFLKAADNLIGGITAFSEIIVRKSGVSLQDVEEKNDHILYKQLFLEDPGSPQDLRQPEALKALIGSQIQNRELDAYLDETQKSVFFPASFCQVLTRSFREILGVKVKFTDDTCFLFDGQLSTVWAAAKNIPFDFSVTYNEIKSYVNSYLQGKPMVLFMGPEKGEVVGAFFQFLLNLSSVEKKILSLTLFDNKAQELEVVDFTMVNDKKSRIIFGLWPWQYGQYRKITYLENFKFYSSEQAKQHFYIAEVNVELTQPIVNNKLILRGCALKNSLNDKVRLVILTNAPASELPASDLVDTYLERWPNLEESYEDYNRKNELFFYTDTSKAPLSLGAGFEPSLGMEKLFSCYLQALDLYAKWRFFPQGYRKKDFSTMKKLFYGLPCRLKKAKNKLSVTFILPADSPSLKDLTYACRRVNERKILLKGAFRLFMEVMPRPIDNSIASN